MRDTARLRARRALAIVLLALAVALALDVALALAVALLALAMPLRVPARGVRLGACLGHPAGCERPGWCHRLRVRWHVLRCRGRVRRADGIVGEPLDRR